MNRFRASLFTVIFTAAMLVAVSVSHAAASSPDDIVASYKYDHALPLNATTDETIDRGTFTQYHITIDSTDGRRLPLLLFVPTKGAAPFPCIMVQHGYNQDKSFSMLFASTFAQKGMAVVAIDLEYHGERKQPGKDVISTDIPSNATALHQTAMDQMRAIDYVSSRSDIDSHRIGYLGVSLGSFMGSITTGIDSRFKAVVLMVGGGDWGILYELTQISTMQPIRDLYASKGLTAADYKTDMQIVEPLTFIPRLSPRPLYMMNCKGDKLVPKPTTDALYAAAQDPKQIEWYTCGGPEQHIPPMEKVPGQARAFFVKNLK